MNNDTLGGVEMSDEEAFAALQQLDDEAMPQTIPRIASIIAKGKAANKTDMQIATEICGFIFEGEPKGIKHV